MLNRTATESSLHAPSFSAPNSTHSQKGFITLLSISGIAMTLALPIGVIPRLMQSNELNQVHQKIVNQVPNVSVTHTELAPTQQTLNLPGNIEAITETSIFARSNGYVKKRFVDIGDHVTAGQLLAKMETPEIEDSEKEAKAQLLTSVAGKAQSDANSNRAQADLAHAIAQLSQAKASLVERQSNEAFAKSTTQRWRILGEQGAVSLQDVDEKETNYKTSVATRQAAEELVNAAQSDVVAARARLKAEQANVDLNAATVEAATAHANRSTTERSFQNVSSPFDGIITERNIENGSLISSGSDLSKLPMFRVARIDTAKVFVDVPQYSSRGIHVGQEVSVNLKEFPGKIFIGKVARTSVALDSTARTLRTEIHIPNHDLTLVPGMYADVNFSITRPQATFLIPANSLIVRAEGPQVATLTAGKVHYKEIKLGEDLGKQVEVVAGLNKNDVVLVNPSDTLTEGTLVAVSQ